MTLFRKRFDWQEQIDLVLVLLTVFFFYLAFPSGGYGFVAWFAIVPVLIAIPKTKGKHAFFLGFLSGLLGWMSSIWWAVDGLAKISSSHESTIIPLLFVFCLVSAVPYGIITWSAAKYDWLSSITGVVKLTALLTLLINFIPQLLPGSLVHSLYLNPEFIQLASIGGVPLVFFILHLVNILIACALIHLRRRYKLSLTACTLAIVIFLGNALYGSIVLSFDQLEDDTETVNIGYVQPNFSTSLRSREDAELAYAKFDPLVTSLMSDSESLDLIVLPEVSIPLSYRSYELDKTAINQWSTHNDVLYAGIGFVDEATKTTQYFNTVELISNTDLKATYDKQRLLPFAEYLPFEDTFSWLRDLFPYVPQFTKGEGVPIINVMGERREFSIVPLICYEGVFSEVVANGVAHGGQILINVVNDGWFVAQAGKQVHLALTLFRAVEFHKPLVRVSNSGISVAIDANGQFIPDTKLAIDQPQAHEVSLTINSEQTIYAQYPYVFFIILLIILCLPSPRNKNV